MRYEVPGGRIGEIGRQSIKNQYAAISHCAVTRYCVQLSMLNCRKKANAQTHNLEYSHQNKEESGGKRRQRRPKTKEAADSGECCNANDNRHDNFNGREVAAEYMWNT